LNKPALFECATIPALQVFQTPERDPPRESPPFPQTQRQLLEQEDQRQLEEMMVQAEGLNLFSQELAYCESGFGSLPKLRNQPSYTDNQTSLVASDFNVVIPGSNLGTT
jgi:hypothetical protein